MDACYDGGSTFRLKMFLKEGTPYPKIVGKRKKMVDHFLFCMTLVAYPGHGIFHAAVIQFLSK